MTENADARVPDSWTSAGGAAYGALHWFDFICPFCYVSQDRDEILIDSGFDVAELPFQAHPEIPPEGVLVGERRGPMYEALGQKAKDAGLALNWPARLPNSRNALAASAWIRRDHPGVARTFNAKLFRAHFELGQDLGDIGIVTQYAIELGADEKGLRSALADGSALKAVSDAERLAHGYGVRGTPAWLVNGTRIDGAIPVNDFRGLVDKARGTKA